MSMATKNKIIIIPHSGRTFAQEFAGDSPYYAPGVAKSAEYVIKSVLEAAGYELVSKADANEAVCAVIYLCNIDMGLLLKHPEYIHIFLSQEPHIIARINTKHGLRRLNRVMDYSISEYENVADPENGVYVIPGFSNFDVSFDPPPLSERTLLMAVVCSRLHVPFAPEELYSERERVIDWFEKNAPDCFRFWGGRWDDMRKQYRCYGGHADCKLACMSQAKFALCFENAKDQLGYLDDKLFDGMFAGCVPVYWGARNITDYVPADCFIDYREFGSPEALYRHLDQMSDMEIEGYLARIRTWLASDEKERFSCKRWAEKTLEFLSLGKRAHPGAIDCLSVYLQHIGTLAMVALGFFAEEGAFGAMTHIARGVWKRCRRLEKKR